MIMLKVTFESELSEQEAFRIAEERLPLFRNVPGLIQKYYIKGPQPNQYSGIYIWDSMEAMKNYRESELAASIPAAYKVKGQPQLEMGDVFTTLRD